MDIILIGFMIAVAVLLLCIGALLYLLIRRSDKMRVEMVKDRALSSNDLQHSRQETMHQLDEVFTKLEKLNLSSSQATTAVMAMSHQVQSMNDVMVNAKRRGSWGEYQLEQIVRTYLGDSLELYDTQVHLENGKIADGVFHLPGTDKVMCIDSKFPMENYLAMAEDPENAGYYEKELRRNIKKHINDVADKYILPVQTADQAMLFIPSEAIYEYICAQGRDLMELAMSRHIMLVSPTTLCGVLFTLLASTRDFYRAKNLEDIEKNLHYLEEDIRRLKDRSTRLEGLVTRLASSSKEIQVSAEKIENRFSRMLNGKGELEENDVCHEG